MTSRHRSDPRRRALLRRQGGQLVTGDDVGGVHVGDAELLEDRTLRVRFQNSYELHAAEALEAFRSTHTQGKLSIAIS
jgi:hypothetical protein